MTDDQPPPPRFGTGTLAVFGRSAGVKALTLVVNALLVLALPRAIGAQSYADYAFLLSVLALSVGIFRAPIELLIQRSYHVVGGGYSTAYDVRGLRQMIVATTIVAAVVFLGGVALGQHRASPLALALLALAAAVSVLSGLRRGLLMVSNRTDQVDVLDLLIRPALFLALMLIAARLTGPADAMMPWALGASYLLVLLAPNLRAFATLADNTQGGSARLRADWLKLAASSGLSALAKSADVLVLSALIGGPEIGSYYILARIADLLAFGNNYAAMRYTHRFAHAARHRDLATADRCLGAATRLSAAVAVVAAVIGLGLGYWFLPVVQPGLDRFYSAFVILVGAGLVNGLFGPRGSFLGALRPGLNLALKAGNLLFGLAVLVFAVRHYGVIGAAAATGFSLVSANLLSAAGYFVQRRFLARGVAGS